jgi:hypothetical protein
MDAGAAGRVEVRRSGGFIGRTATGSLDLASDDPRVPAVRALLDADDLAAALASAPGGPPHPDRFVYTFTLPGHPPYTVADQHLTPALHRLADLVLTGTDR